mmetsp:Transcript_28640/g.63546  ORF Transcript_28640/g.63546 Transcript_28640/m.63546 type:complete len:196 (+) Transcript_28640:117-704(+)
MGNAWKTSTLYPVWVLGASYQEGQDELVRRHAESFFRFTYRRNMPPLLPSQLTSDGGWGCMLRAAQMLMGHTLRLHLLGDDWRLPTRRRLWALASSAPYCDLVRWFSDHPDAPAEADAGSLDSPSQRHHYSLHAIAQMGLRYGKQPGEWCGPSTAAMVLRDLARLHCAVAFLEDELREKRLAEGQRQGQQQGMGL